MDPSFARERNGSEEGGSPEKTLESTGVPSGVPDSPDTIELDLVPSAGQTRAQISASEVTEIPWNRERQKEMGAQVIAYALMGIFGVSVVGVLVWAGIIIAVSRSPTEAEQFVKAIAPLLGELSKFASSVFSPLLAFILGYYFSEKQRGT